MTRLLLAIAALVAVLVLAMATMGDDGNYAAERTAQVQAQEAARTERTALTEANQTERTAINAALLQWQMAQEAQTMRLALLLFVGVIVAGMTTVVIVVALRRPAQAATLLPGEIPQPSAALLQMWRWYPSHTLEYNEDLQQWSLVAADGRYMLESELVQASPRRIAQR
jgi:Flp pilus assembly protein TadB